jgi:thiamine-monophosphate kinase
MRLSELGEDALLRELERRGLARGITDDVAVVQDRVVTQDALVQDVHFRLDQMSWRDLGWRAAAVNLSDLAAAGATADALVVTLAAPRSTEVEDVFELYAGIRETGVPVVGGDTTEAPAVVLSVTALGRSPRVPGRGGAVPGDVLIVTGALGASGAAFRRGGYVRPPLRLREGRELAPRAHALMDLSDGLGIDCRRMAAASGCALIVELERVPLAEDALLRDLAFGEDYELLAAVESAPPFTPIGRCVAGSGVTFLLHGEPFELAGWQHFA